MDHFPNFRGENKSNYLSCHHLNSQNPNLDMSNIFEKILHFTTITTSISNTPGGHSSIRHDHGKSSVVALDLLDIFQSSGGKADRTVEKVGQNK